MITPANFILDWLDRLTPARRRCLRRELLAVRDRIVARHETADPTRSLAAALLVVYARHHALSPLEVRSLVPAATRRCLDAVQTLALRSLGRGSRRRSPGTPRRDRWTSPADVDPA